MKGLSTLLILLVLSTACNQVGDILGGNILVNVKEKNNKPVINQVKIQNDQIIVSGSHLDSVTTAKVGAHDFQIESKTSDKLVLNAKSALSFIVGQTFELIISSASASATFPFTFDLQNGQVTAAKLHHMNASNGDFLQFNGSTWAPASISTNQVYVGTYNATTDTPNLSGGVAAAGTYYIVTTAGSQDLGSGVMNFDVGDWVISDGTNWSKVAVGTNTVSNFNGRTGAVVPLSGDYSWSMLTKAAGKLTGSKLQEIADVDVTGIQDEDILQWNAGTSKWEVTSVPAPVITAGSITNTQLANSAVDSNKIVDGTIVNADISATAAIDQSKINGLTTALSNKEPSITAGTAAQYWSGTKTWQNLNPAVLGSTLTGFSSTTGAVTAADTVLSAFNKLTGNIGVVAASQGNYVLKAGDTMSGPLAMGNNKITGLATPTAGTDAATKDYVDTKAGTASQWTTVGSDIQYSAGNVVIGTATAESMLHLKGEGSAGATVHRISDLHPPFLSLTRSRGTAGSETKVQVGDNLGQLRFRGLTRNNTNTADTSLILSQIIAQVEAVDGDQKASSKLGFYTAANSESATVKMTITSAGDVGIGTATPLDKLSVIGNVALSGGVRMKSDTVNYVELLAPAGLGSNLSFRLPASAGTTGQALITDGAGNLSWSTVSSGTPADGSITLEKLAGASDATKYLKGDKTWGTFITDVLASTFATVTPNNTVIANGDSLQTIVNKTQGQISNLASNSLNKTGTDTITGTLTINAATGALKIPATPSGIDLTDAANVQYVQNYVDTFGKWNKNGSDIYYNGGNVGIGTNAPIARLHIKDSQDGLIIAQVENTSTGTAASSTLNAVSDGAGIGVEAFSSTFPGNWGTVPKADSVTLRAHSGSPPANMLVGTSTAVPLHLMVQSTPRMTLLPNGYTGIGTTAPTNHFEVITELDAITKMGIFNNHATGTTANTQLFASNEKNSIALGILGTSNTNLGYGSPGDSYIYNSGGTSTGKNFNIINNQSGGIKFYAGSTALSGVPKFMIDGSTGNIGIGTNSPTSFLHMFSEGTTFKEMKIDAARNNSGAYGITFSKSRGTSAARTQTLNNDALGDINFIGFTDAGVVAPDASARIRAVAEENLTATGFGGALVFQTVTAATATMSERMRINSAGNVGIGTNTPSYKLSVLDSIAPNGTNTGVFYAATGTDATLGPLSFNVWGHPSATAGSRYMGISAADFVGVRHLVLNMASNGIQGNVGIGTTSPQALLEVSSSGNSIINNSISDDTRYTALRMFTLRGNPLETMGSANPSAGNKGWEFGANGNSYATATLRNVLTMNHWNGTAWSTPMAILPTGEVGIGTTTPGYKLHVNGSVAGVGAYNALSDRRYKKDFEKIPDALERVVALNGFYYKWRQSEHPDMQFEKGRDMGVIAQEVQKVFPEAVSTDKKSGIMSVAYSKLIAPIIEAIKDLFGQVSELKREVASVKEENAALKAYICEKDPKAPFCKTGK